MKLFWAGLAIIAVAFVAWTYNREQINSRPDLPIQVGERAALLGPGLVLRIKNTSGQMLDLAATLESPNTGTQSTRRLVIPPGGVQEIGHLEGWEFAPGQKVDFRNDLFRPATFIVR